MEIRDADGPYGSESESGLEKVKRILARQIEAVRDFSPKEILTHEKRAEIVERVTYGLGWISSEIKETAKGEGRPCDEVTLEMGLGMNEFARTALAVSPLPPYSLREEIPLGHPEEMMAFLEERVADAYDHWWDELSLAQQEAFWQILEKEFGVSPKLKTESIKTPGFEDCQVIRSQKIIRVQPLEEEPEIKFQPALVLPPQGKGEPYLTGYVVE